MPWDFWLIFFALGAILPWRGRARLKKLLAMPQVGPPERLALYASTIAFQWIAAAVTAWRAWSRGLTPGELGLAIHGRTRILAAAIVGAAIVASLQWLNLRRIGRSSGKAREFMQALAERILPRSSVELLPYLGLAVTAGLCEEFLYRGFAMAALTRFVGTMLIGAVFGTARIVYGGLAPVVLWHIAVDAVAGIAGPRYLLRAAKPVLGAET